MGFVSWAYLGVDKLDVHTSHLLQFCYLSFVSLKVTDKAHTINNYLITVVSSAHIIYRVSAHGCLKFTGEKMGVDAYMEKPFVCKTYIYTQTIGSKMGGGRLYGDGRLLGNYGTRRSQGKNPTYLQVYGTITSTIQSCKYAKHYMLLAMEAHKTQTVSQGKSSNTPTGVWYNYQYSGTSE